MEGLIFVNPYLIPEESVAQAERLKAEFAALGVGVRIVSDGFLNVSLDGKGLKTAYACDFAVFLDKDKYLSGALKKTDVRLFNSHDSIRVCDDKAETYLALTGKGVNIPETVFGGLCHGKNAEIISGSAEKIADRLGLPVSVKESFGSMGKGVYLAENLEELKTVMEKVKCKPHLFQKYLGFKRGVDVRVIVIGGKAVSAMERYNENDFRSNVALGGKCRKINPPTEFISVAEKCADILGLDYCGVDLLYGDNGEPYVCEVNSNAFFFGFERTTGVNVARLYAEYIVEKIKAGEERE